MSCGSRSGWSSADDGLALAQALGLVAARLLDAEDHVGLLVQVVGLDDLRAGRLEGRVGDQRAHAGARLDEDLEAGGGQLRQRVGDERDAALAGRGLAGDSDLHPGDHVELGILRWRGLRSAFRAIPHGAAPGRSLAGIRDRSRPCIVASTITRGDPTMIPVAKLNHAVLYVRDAQASADFYGRVFGFEVVSSEFGGRAVFMRAGGGDNHHDLGLFSVGPEAPRAPRGSTGLYHLAWEVPTIEDLAAAARELSDGRRARRRERPRRLEVALRQRPGRQRVRDHVARARASSGASSSSAARSCRSTSTPRSAAGAPRARRRARPERAPTDGELHQRQHVDVPEGAPQDRAGPPVQPGEDRAADERRPQLDLGLADVGQDERHELDDDERQRADPPPQREHQEAAQQELRRDELDEVVEDERLDRAPEVP